MSAANIGMLLFAVALAACGQLLLKRGMTIAQARSHDNGRPLLLVAASSPWIIGGLAIFAMSAVFWLVILSRIPLSQAYPFNALGYIAILLASSVLLHERTNPWTWAGTTLVVGGLIMIVATTPA